MLVRFPQIKWIDEMHVFYMSFCMVWYLFLEKSKEIYLETGGFSCYPLRKNDNKLLFLWFLHFLTHFTYSMLLSFSLGKIEFFRHFCQSCLTFQRNRIIAHILNIFQFELTQNFSSKMSGFTQEQIPAFCEYYSLFF